MELKLQVCNADVLINDAATSNQFCFQIFHFFLVFFDDFILMQKNMIEIKKWAISPMPKKYPFRMFYANGQVSTAWMFNIIQFPL